MSTILQYATIIVRQLLLLWYKNMLHFRRSIFSILILAILVPASLAALLSIPAVAKLDSSTRYGIGAISPLPSNWTTFLSPSNTNPLQFAWVDQTTSPNVAQSIVNQLGIDVRYIRSYPTAKEMETACEASEIQASPCWMGLVFTNLTSPDFAYTLRTPRDPFAVDIGSNNMTVQNYGAISLQWAIDKAIVSTLIAKSSVLNEWQVNGQPFTSDAQNQHLKEDIQQQFTSLRKYIAGLYVLCMLYVVHSLVQSISLEKETRMKETMSMMGLNDIAYYLSWLFSQTTIHILGWFVVAVIIKYMAFKSIPLAHVFVHFLLSGISFVGFGLVLCAFFSHPRFSGLFSMVLVALVAAAGQALSLVVQSATAWTALCLLSPVAFVFGIVNLVLIEIDDRTGSPSGINDIPSGGYISLQIVWGMLVLDIVLYIFLAWYLELTVPSKYGVKRPFYFLFQPSYWKMSSRAADILTEQTTSSQQDLIESPRQNLPVSVSLRGLTKIFPGAEDPAVNNLTLDMYEGQVLALLGHNGSGKSTTISMLSGLIKSTSGDALLHGYSTLHDMQKIKALLGVCPQHDVLFPELTVYQTLLIFAALKGVPFFKASGVVDQIIVEAGLVEKKNARAKTLSGGQKRKLSVAVAFIGGSPIVFLDEPTSGMDPLSRRNLWKFITNHRGDANGGKGRTIILTTHFLDEADILGDRIAIMSHGRLQCVGSSLFLKSRLGKGYTLTAIFDKIGMTTSNKSLAESLVSSLSTITPGIEVISNSGAEIAISIPKQCTAQLPALLRHLDQQKHNLGVLSYGVSGATLETVFLRMMAEDTERQNRSLPLRHGLAQSDFGVENLDSGDGIQLVEDHHNSYKPFSNDMNFDGLSSDPRPNSLIQLWAIFEKRVLAGAKEWKLTLLPLACVLLLQGIAIATVKPDFDNGTCALFDFYNQSTVDISFQTLSTTDQLVFAPEAINLQTLLGTTNNVSANTSSIPSSQYQAYIASHVTTLFGGVEYVSSSNQTDAIQTVNIAYNQQNPNAPFTLLNLIGNSALTTLVKTANDTLPVLPRIRTTIQPWPGSQFSSGSQFTIFVMLSALGYMLYPAFSAVYLVRENVSGGKRLQRISGVNGPTYWLGNLAYDVIVIAVVSLVGALMINLHVGPHWLIPLRFTFTVLFLHSAAVTIMAYLMSAAGVKTSGGAIGAVLGYGVLWLIIFMSSYITVQVSSDLSKDAGEVIFLAVTWVSPTVGLLQALFVGVNMFGAQCKVNPTVDSNIAAESMLEPSMLGLSLLSFLVQIVALFLLTLLLEDWSSVRNMFVLASGRRRRIARATFDEHDPIDSDVLAEQERIGQMGNTRPSSKEQILLSHLRKKFSKKVAVQDTSFGVERGECFGLIGMNGAGKTTTLSVIAGETTPTSGEVQVAGRSVYDSLAFIRRSIGVVPQFDCVVAGLTVRQQLRFFARLRGVKRECIERDVDWLVHRLGLQEHEHKLVKRLSGGNKRRVSLATALLGNPPILLIDEVSTGMDVAAKRFTWSILESLQSSKAIILTSHSMEEVDAVCSRVGIMVGGRLRALGSPQSLKTKFGAGYQLEISVADDGAADERVVRFMQERVPGVRLLERYGGHVRFEVPLQGGLTLASVFEMIEANGAELGVLDYSVSQTSLEQVFLRIAEKYEVVQDEDDSPPKKRWGCCGCCGCCGRRKKTRQFRQADIELV